MALRILWDAEDTGGAGVRQEVGGDSSREGHKSWERLTGKMCCGSPGWDTFALNLGPAGVVLCVLRVRFL